MPKNTIKYLFMLAVMMVLPLSAAAQKAVVKAAVGSSAFDKLLEQQIMKQVEMATVNKLAFSELESLTEEFGTGAVAAEVVKQPQVPVDKEWAAIERVSSRWNEAQSAIVRAQATLKQTNAVLQKNGFTMSPDGKVMFALTPAALKKLRAHALALDSEHAFFTKDLSEFKPQLENPNTLALLPKGFIKDIGTRYLGYKYIGLRINAEKDVNALIREFKANDVSKQVEKALVKTENDVLINGNIWVKTMEGLPFQLNIVEDKVGLYNDFEIETKPAPYHVIGLVDTGVNRAFNPSAVSHGTWPDMISRIIMQLEVKGKLVWAEVEIVSEETFKVTPFLP